MLGAKDTIGTYARFHGTRETLKSLLDYILVSRYSFSMELPAIQKVFSALSDSTRFRILCLLQEGELCVCDVMSVLKEPQSKISRHLAYLRRAGLVEARKEGLWMYYRLVKSDVKTFRTILESLKHAQADFDEVSKDCWEFKKSKKGLVSGCN